MKWGAIASFLIKEGCVLVGLSRISVDARLSGGLKGARAEAQIQ